LLIDGPISGRFWEPGTIPTAEIYRIRIRGAANGFS
jgi:hypothetical protein